jgi:hypothetical protein
MMQKNLSFISIIVFLVMLAGCTGGPPSPLSSIPTILIDHIEDTEETKIYVHGIDDTLYGNITIQINNETKLENFTYSLQTNTVLNKFFLNVTVWYKMKEYEYNGNLTLVEEDGDTSFDIVDDRHDNPINRNAPYTIIMERK